MLPRSKSTWLGILAALVGVVYSLYLERVGDLYVFILILAGLFFIPWATSRLERVVWLTVALAPISIPLALPFLGLRMSFPSEMLSAFLVVLYSVKVLGGLSMKSAFLKHPITVVLFIDIVWSLASAFQSELTLVTMKRVAMKLLFFLAFYIVFGHFLDCAKKRRYLFWLYGLGLLYPVFHAMSVHAHTNFIQASSFSIPQPFYSDHTVYGACLAFIIPFFVISARRKNESKASLRWLSWAVLTIVTLAVVLSYSRASWISLVVALLFFVAIRLKAQWYHILFALVVGSFVISTNFESIYGSLRESEAKYGDDITAHIMSVTNLQSDASNLERVNRWVCAYRMFEEKPIFGFGPGTYQFEYDKFQTPEFMTRISTHAGNRGNAHSEYLTSLSETGIVGFVLLVVLIFYCIRVAVGLINSGSISKEDRLLVYASILGLITFFSHGLFNTFSDCEKMSILVLGSMGILVNIDLKHRKNQHGATPENREISV